MLAGRRGEEAAEQFLRGIGYLIIACNVRLNRDEIDIVAFDPTDRVYVFVEVKARSRADSDYRPELNITRQKRACMKRAARRYMTGIPEEIGYRLDVVCVMHDKVVDHYIQVNCE